MANICNNTLEFSGEDQNIKNVYALFQKLKKQNDNEKVGAMPDFLNYKEGYFFDLYVEDGLSIDYWTKWAPNEAIIKDIADRYKVDFTLAYAELSCGLFGRFFYDYQTKILADICLTDSEMDLVSCDDNGIYFYEGKEIECQEDIYNELLDAKIKAINLMVEKYEADNIEHIFETVLISRKIGAPLADEIITELKENSLLISFEDWEKKFNNN
jgi:hypothetical protein